MTPVDLARAAALFRIVLGGAVAAAPALASRPWVGPEIDQPVAKLYARMFGIREALLGAGILLVLADGERAARWLRLGAVADAVDGVAVIGAWRHLPKVTRYGDAAMAFGASVLNARAAQLLARSS